MNGSVCVPVCVHAYKCARARACVCAHRCGFVCPCECVRATVDSLAVALALVGPSVVVLFKIRCLLA